MCLHETDRTNQTDPVSPATKRRFAMAMPSTGREKELRYQPKQRHWLMNANMVAGEAIHTQARVLTMSKN
jgi:hypothetical protein